jgi:dTDP-4-dehydrorhamnose 3,5-epimerase
MKKQSNTQDLLIKPQLQIYSKKEVIKDVKVIKYPIFPSEGGDFAEFFRIVKGGVTLGRGDSLVKIKNFSPKQISRSYTPPGIIKAWHIHTKQNEIFFPISGRFIIGLFDNRKNSSTRNMKMKIYAGTDNQVAIFIPKGVAHGYKNIGADDCLLVYATNQYWNGSDEGRIVWDSKQISFNWDIENG